MYLNTLLDPEVITTMVPILQYTIIHKIITAVKTIPVHIGCVPVDHIVSFEC